MTDADSTAEGIGRDFVRDIVRADLAAGRTQTVITRFLSCLTTPSTSTSVFIRPVSIATSGASSRTRSSDQPIVT